ncbi:methyltransferase domain-containing protein [Alteromonas lipolytica]|uniref:Methyltransferase type 11 domain-containing protein n=1 Tax=Alteromonas lipolytica TaxID=1856405 RepID=A0A1E8FEN8_9ALTE|nr:methyltransferase domain-containing protein [Alteromonas lipolytica]OFI34379.1 hypothetical protein BFC17_18550 [Alteromonas lipolytica]GGF81962.1 malonyl-[acyl-carrier protein] O-methyltransferase [Alteromonas lipolytica]
MALIEPQECVQQATQKQDVAKRFSAAARQYDTLATVQSAIAGSALARITTAKATKALDIGCGTGRHTYQLGLISQQTTGLDIAPGMLAQAAANYPMLSFVQGDAEQLPWQADEFDLVFSSMVLQWCRSPLVAMQEIKRVLQPGGKAELAIMVEGSFGELRQGCAGSGVTLRINPLFSAIDWLNAAKQAGLACGDQNTLDYPDRFDSVLPLLRSIKCIGAGSSTNQATSQPLSRCDLKALEGQMLAAGNGQLTNTYKVLHLSLEKLL